MTILTTIPEAQIEALQIVEFLFVMPLQYYFTAACTANV